MSIVRPHIAGLVLLALVPACSDQTRRSSLGPSFDETGFPTLSGTVLGPAGNICNSLPESSPLLVRVFDPASSFFAGAVDLTCPENGYNFGLEPGSYLPG